MEVKELIGGKGRAARNVFGVEASTFQTQDLIEWEGEEGRDSYCKTRESLGFFSVFSLTFLLYVSMSAHKCYRRKSLGNTIRRGALNIEKRT